MIEKNIIGGQLKEKNYNGIEDKKKGKEKLDKFLENVKLHGKLLEGLNKWY